MAFNKVCGDTLSEALDYIGGNMGRSRNGGMLNNEAPIGTGAIFGIVYPPAAALPFGAGCRKAHTANTVSCRYAYISATHLQSMNRFNLDAPASMLTHTSWADLGMTGIPNGWNMPCSHAEVWPLTCRRVRKHA